MILLLSLKFVFGTATVIISRAIWRVLQAKLLEKSCASRLGALSSALISRR